MKVPTSIAVYGGSFDSQPLVFAHLADALPGLELDEVEVVCREDPAKRLAHVLAARQVQTVEDALGLADTCVLVFPEAGGEPLPDATAHLTLVGRFSGHRHRPDPVAEGGA
jgi:hypothetical protein